MKKHQFFVFLLFFWMSSLAQEHRSQKDIRDFVSKTYIHGLPYQGAKSFGPETLPILENLLYDPSYADHRDNIVLCIGIIGGNSGFVPLRDYLYNQHGEVNYPTFLSLLVALPALGHVAQNGNKEAMLLLKQLSNNDDRTGMQLNFSYKNYKGSSMALLISKLAIQGLGISGKPEALEILTEMSNPKGTRYKANLQNDLKDAIKLNKKIQSEGAAKAFEKEQVK